MDRLKRCKRRTTIGEKRSGVSAARAEGSGKEKGNKLIKSNVKYNNSNPIRSNYWSAHSISAPPSCHPPSINDTIIYSSCSSAAALRSLPCAQPNELWCILLIACFLRVEFKVKLRLLFVLFCVFCFFLYFISYCCNKIIFSSRVPPTLCSSVDQAPNTRISFDIYSNSPPLCFSR